MKRLFDIVFSATALLTLAIPLLILAFAVRWKLGKPVLFRPIRVGLGNKPIRVVKFRTMTDDRGPDGELLPDEARLTPFGRFLRRSSLDELPQFWCVLIGDMSVIGPRPLPPKYLPFYSPEQARRHLVKPGVSGWAQINGRNSLSWEEKFRLDTWYVDHSSLWLDLKIIWLTIGTVIQRQGINAAGDATVPDFTGSHAPQSATDEAALTQNEDLQSHSML
ncbi:sugar transferase [Cupriavidus pinatubonensis]|uniref:Sugar transferase EpsL n=1 Tax=Cupriavidus pinatubonensis TaxID=248026 RepID=A0ABM8XXE6_9BURK|nr:sugar transferase [Cupriavidus pinatubonensis]CAG9185044.1 putative sugar transferase EpsL [Cupriavidus pinatubonensis]